MVTVSFAFVGVNYSTDNGLMTASHCSARLVHSSCPPPTWASPCRRCWLSSCLYAQHAYQHRDVCPQAKHPTGQAYAGTARAVLIGEDSIVAPSTAIILMALHTCDRRQ